MEKLCFCQDLLVEFQVKDEGLAEGFHREAALSQMDGLVGESKERVRQDGTISSLISQAAGGQSQRPLTACVSIT